MITQEIYNLSTSQTSQNDSGSVF